MSTHILEVENVSKRFCKQPEKALRYATSDMFRELTGRAPDPERLRQGEFWALKNVSFTLEKGEVMGVIGHNGAGKSTLINLVAGLMRPTTGSIKLFTTRVALMDSSGGLNMVETGRENISTQLALHGCPEHDIARQSEAVIAFAELGSFIDAPVGTFSLGMKLRLAFSIYTCLKPDLFIVDEALSGGDIRFRRKFQNYLKGYLDDGGSILFCSHELFFVQSLCKNCLLLDTGNLLASGQTMGVLKTYQAMMQDSTASKLLPEVPPEYEADKTEEALEEMVQSTIAESGHDSGSSSEPQVQHEVGDTPRIESVSISPIGGAHLRSGQPAEIVVVATSPENLDSILVSIEISAGGELPLATIIDGYGEHSYSLKEGTNVYRGIIKHLPFVPGKYEMRACISDDSTAAVLAWYGYEDVPISFEIPNPADKEFNLVMHRQNSVYVSVDWK